MYIRRLQREGQIYTYKQVNDQCLEQLWEARNTLVELGVGALERCFSDVRGTGSVIRFDIESRDSG